MEVEIERLLEESPADPRRHLDQDRVRRYAEVLDQLPPVVVFELGDHTLLLADGYHRVAAAQLAGRTTVQAEVRVGTKKQALQFAIDVARAEWGCQLTRHETLFSTTAVVRATMLGRTMIRCSSSASSQAQRRARLQQARRVS